MAQVVLDLQKTISRYEELERSLEIKFLQVEGLISGSGIKELMIDSILQNHSDAINIKFRYTREGLRINYFRPGSSMEFLIFYPWDDPVFDLYE